MKPERFSPAGNFFPASQIELIHSTFLSGLFADSGPVKIRLYWL